jgi:predicted DNA-binding transcriptional regulator YafY
LPPGVDETVLGTVQEALGEERQLRVAYQAAGEKEAKELELYPLGLILVGPTGYLIATTFQYPEVCRYAIHRIRSAEKLDTPIRRHRAFNLDDYITGGGMQFGSGKRLRLTARVQEVLAESLAETPLANDQRLTPAGEEWRTLTATVADTWQLRWWLLGHAYQIVIEKPLGLRHELAETLQTAAEYYSD